MGSTFDEEDLTSLSPMAGRRSLHSRGRVALSATPLLGRTGFTPIAR
jgi:hypothetical protein